MRYETNLIGGARDLRIALPCLTHLILTIRNSTPGNVLCQEKSEIQTTENFALAKAGPMRLESGFLLGSLAAPRCPSRKRVDGEQLRNPRNPGIGISGQDGFRCRRKREPVSIFAETLLGL